jgi:hypothetical protein
MGVSRRAVALEQVFECDEAAERAARSEGEEDREQPDRRQSRERS